MRGAQWSLGPLHSALDTFKDYLLFNAGRYKATWGCPSALAPRCRVPGSDQPPGGGRGFSSWAPSPGNAWPRLLGLRCGPPSLTRWLRPALTRGLHFAPLLGRRMAASPPGEGRRPRPQQARGVPRAEAAAAAAAGAWTSVAARRRQPPVPAKSSLSGRGQASGRRRPPLGHVSLSLPVAPWLQRRVRRAPWTGRKRRELS